MEDYEKEVELAIQHLEHVRFDKKHAWHRTLISLYCALIEYSHTLLYLVKGDRAIGVPLVFRSILEGYVDFKNLTEDRKYGYYLDASYAKEWTKVLDEASKKTNPFLTAIADNADFNREKQRLQAELSNLMAAGYDPLNQFEKLDKADMSDEYRSIYNFCCAYSHNNVRALIERFLVLNEEGTDFYVELFRECDPAEYEPYLMTGRHYLRNASHNLHRVLDTGLENEFPV